MKRYINWVVVLALTGAVGCTSLSEGGGGTLPPDPAHAERVRYGNADQTLLRRQMGGQASEINRKRNIEEFDHNGPATTPPEARPQQLPNAPVDSTRHRILRPLPTRLPVGN